MFADIETHYQMRLWCIENIPMRNSYRQWRFEYPKGQNYSDPYEFVPFFDHAEDKTSFEEKFNVRAKAE